METWRNIIRQFLYQRDWTQDRLAKESGITAGRLSDIMNGRREPSVEYLRRIGKALGISASELLATFEGIEKLTAGEIEKEDQKPTPDHVPEINVEELHRAIHEIQDSMRSASRGWARLKNSVSERHRILIVEDHQPTALILKKILECDGFNACIIDTADEALRVLDEREKPADLVILDVMLPGSIDGYELCIHIRKSATLQHIPVVILSALVEEHHIVRGFQAGATDYVTKPFRNGELLARVRRALNIESILG